MQQLTNQAEQSIQSLSQRYGVSSDAVRTLLFAVSAGGGTMAQFSHPEFGGSGQWMSGGMTMVGDMFNQRLASTVSGLCGELSNLLAQGAVFVPAPSTGWNQPSSWWPSDLGSPSSSGSQNGSRYAVFPQARRIAVERMGGVFVYDSLNHQIGGVQQQQGGLDGSLSFSSQFGTFTVESLPLISPLPPPAPWQPAPEPVPPAVVQPPAAPPAPLPQGGAQAQGPGEIINAIERLASLHKQGFVSDEEFRTKKAELLARL